MGLLDLFRGKKLPPGDVHTQKAGLKLINKNADAATRYAAADTLSDIGTEEAIYCLLQRFTVVIGTHSPDADEKAYVRNKILSFGKKSIQPLMKFLREKENAAPALEILKKVAPDETVLDLLLELVRGFDPYFSKYPDKKIEVFRTLKDFTDDRIIDELEPFLDDDDDDVRIMALEAISRQTDKKRVRSLLIDAIIESHERPRIRIAACEAFAQQKFKVKDQRKQISQVLPDRFYLDSKGHILAKSQFS